MRAFYSELCPRVKWLAAPVKKGELHLRTLYDVHIKNLNMECRYTGATADVPIVLLM